MRSPAELTGQAEPTGQPAGPPASQPTSTGTDWLGDAVEVARRESRWFGPLRSTVLRLTSWADRRLVAALRRHPLLGAAVAAAVFGLGVGGNQALHEGYDWSATLLTMGLLNCGMFAFLVLAGTYLGVVHSATPWHGARRRAVNASVAACVAAVLTLAFRNFLWWVVGSTPAAAGAGQFGTLLALAILAGFSIVFGAETVLRAHSHRMTRLPRGWAYSSGDACFAGDRRQPR